MEDQLAAAGRRVDALLEAPEADLPFLELSHGLDQVPDAATQAVELPDDEGIPLPEVCEGLIEPRPRGTGTTGLVREELLAPRSRERVGLQIERLVLGRNTGITNEYACPLGLTVSTPMHTSKRQDIVFGTAFGTKPSPASREPA